MIDFICNFIHMVAVRLGIWKSPSLSAMGANPKDYKAEITRNGVSWTLKQKKPDIKNRSEK